MPLFHQFLRVAVEVRVGEQAGGPAGVVEDVEEQLAVIVADAGAPADDLLELGHGVDDPQPGPCSCRSGTSTPVVSICEVVRMTGRLRLQVLEAAQVAAADVALVGDDPAHVIGVLLHQVGVEVVQRPAHLVGVLLVHAEDDRLGEAVGLLQELGQVPGDGLGAGLQRDDPLEVLGPVLARRESPGRSGRFRPGWAASRPRPIG